MAIFSLIHNGDFKWLFSHSYIMTILAIFSGYFGCFLTETVFETWCSLFLVGDTLYFSKCWCMSKRMWNTSTQSVSSLGWQQGSFSCREQDTRTKVFSKNSTSKRVLLLFQTKALCLLISEKGINNYEFKWVKLRHNPYYVWVFSYKMQVTKGQLQADTDFPM